MTLTQNQVKLMPYRPYPGEIWIALNLSAIENMSALEALKLSEDLGFKPELRYSTTKDGPVEIHALLHYEKREYDSVLEADYFEAELEALHDRIQPDVAIRFAYCLKRGKTVAA